MEVVTVSTDFAEYCRQHQNHPDCQKATRVIGEQVQLIPNSGFNALGNGNSEPWARIRTLGEGPIELAIPKRYLIFEEEPEEKRREQVFTAP